MQDYEIELVATDHMLLDVMLRVKAQDDTLSFRRSCREGVCGSDAMNINGRNGLACITRVSELREPVVSPPAGLSDHSRPGRRHDPVLQAVPLDQALLVNPEPPPEKERLQSPAERDKLNGAYECILCACCTANAHRTGGTRTNSSARPACIQAYRFIFDSRDRATKERLDDLETIPTGCSAAARS